MERWAKETMMKKKEVATTLPTAKRQAPTTAGGFQAVVILDKETPSHTVTSKPLSSCTSPSTEVSKDASSTSIASSIDSNTIDTTQSKKVF